MPARHYCTPILTLGPRRSTLFTTGLPSSASAREGPDLFSNAQRPERASSSERSKKTPTATTSHAPHPDDGPALHQAAAAGARGRALPPRHGSALQPTALPKLPHARARARARAGAGLSRPPRPATVACRRLLVPLVSRRRPPLRPPFGRRSRPALPVRRYVEGADGLGLSFGEKRAACLGSVCVCVLGNDVSRSLTHFQSPPNHHHQPTITTTGGDQNNDNNNDGFPGGRGRQSPQGGGGAGGRQQRQPQQPPHAPSAAAASMTPPAAKANTSGGPLKLQGFMEGWVRCLFGLVWSKVLFSVRLNALVTPLTGARSWCPRWAACPS